MMLLTILSYKMIYYNTKKIFVVSNNIGKDEDLYEFISEFE